jgi:NADH dehydrogenase
MSDVPYSGDRLATVFGGSGFLGRHIVRALARRGWRVRVAVRRPDLAAFLRANGAVGQVEAVQANVRFPASIAAALSGADAAVNAVGAKIKRGALTYEAVHVVGAATIAQAAAQAGARALVHVSGIGADAASPSLFVASKGRGEQAVLEAFGGATILRPSIVFGPEDDFLNRFGALSRFCPVLPLFADGKTKLQPVYVGDVAEAAAQVLDGVGKPGTIYELGGPRVMTLREAAEFTLRTVERRRMLLPLPIGPSRALAGATELASAISLGLFPALLTTTRDQVELLARANVVSEAAQSQGRVLSGLGVAAQAMDAIAPAYLVRFRKTGQYASPRVA